MSSGPDEVQGQYLIRLTWLALLLVGYSFLSRLRQYWRLRHFKGPRTSGILWWWHSRAVLSRRAHEYYGGVTEKYGPIARIAPNHLITSDPEFWGRVNAVRSPYRRSPWYYHAARFEPGKDNVFTECDNDRHDARRKRMAPGYSGKENPLLESSIDKHVVDLVALVRKYADTTASDQVSQPMDLAKKIPYFTLDVISHVGLGESFGDLVADADQKDYLRASEEGLEIGNTAFALGIAWLKDTKVVGPLISPSEKDASGFGKMMAEARKLVDARRLESSKARSDMLASFIRHGVSGDDLFQEAFEQILAGSDTTAAAIRIILLYVISHANVCKKLQAEIDAKVATGFNSEVIPDAEARSLPYLGAVIREALRVHPPVVNLFSRVTPKDGDVAIIDGKEYFVPGGTLVGYCAWGMHRNNRAVYGQDAQVFRPERWLPSSRSDASQEQYAKMVKTNDMIFGHGRWSCLGKPIALLEIHKCIFELFRHFDFAISDPTRPWRTLNSLGLWEIRDMWVDVTLRH